MANPYPMFCWAKATPLENNRFSFGVHRIATPTTATTTCPILPSAKASGSSCASTMGATPSYSTWRLIAAKLRTSPRSIPNWWLA